MATALNLNYLLTGPVSKYRHILRYERWGHQQMNLENAILPITIILTDEAGYIDQELNIEYSE